MKLRALVAVLLAMTLVTAACTSTTTETTEAPTTGTETDTTAASGGEDSESGETMDDEGATNRFVYANPFPVFDLDPSSSFSSEHVILQNVYETLTRYDANTDEVTPVLAESWESNEDATVWTFNIREGVTFHDGEALTADAVINSLQRTIDLDLGAAFIFFPVDGMEATDDMTVQFTLAYPAPMDLVLSSTYGAYIISPSALDQSSEWFNEGNDAGTGPYTISSYATNDSTELTAYEGYWGGWTDGQLGTVEIMQVEDPVLAEQLVRGGDADYTYNLPFDVYSSLGETEGLSVVRGQSMTNLFGMLNHVTLSPEVREALVLSFPYDDVADNLYGGEASRALGIIPQSVWGSDPNLAVPDTDLDAAAAVLAGAGISDLSITYSYDAGTTEQQQIGEVWAANLATIGVDLVLEPLTFDARWEIAQSDPEASADVFVMFWFPTYVTPYDYMFSLFRTEEFPFFNLGYYSNEDFDFLIDDADALSGLDREAAAGLFQDAQEILVADSAAVFMIDVPEISVIASDVNGYDPNPAYTNVVRFYELTR